jgi:hypothetical protein
MHIYIYILIYINEQGALESQAEISDDCKIEIQSAVPQFISPEDQVCSNVIYVFIYIYV